MRIVMFSLISLSFVITVFSYVPLGKAIDNGVRINCKIKNSILESRIIEIDHKIKKYNRYFTIKGSGSYLYRSKKVEIKLPDMKTERGGIGSGLKIPGGTNHTYDIGVSVYQPIFTGNILSGLIRLNEYKKDINVNRKEFIELMLRGSIKRIFFNYRMLTKQLESIEILEKKIRNHFNRLEDLFGEGLIEKREILETKLKLREVLLSKEKIGNSKNSLSSMFKELTDYDIKDIEKNYSESIEDLETSRGLFILNHPKLRILSAQKKIISMSKKINKGKNLPQIGSFAEFHYGLPGINFLGKEWNSYFQGGINIKINVFDWGKVGKEDAIYNYNIEKVDNDKKDVIRKIRLKLSQLFKSLKSLKEQADIFKEMIGISKEELELKKMMFEEKQISNKDYLDVVFNVEKRQSLREQTILQIELVKVEINTMIGRKGGK